MYFLLPLLLLLLLFILRFSIGARPQNDNDNLDGILCRMQSFDWKRGVRLHFSNLAKIWFLALHDVLFFPPRMSDVMHRRQIIEWGKATTAASEKASALMRTHTMAMRTITEITRWTYGQQNDVRMRQILKNIHFICLYFHWLSPQVVEFVRALLFLQNKLWFCWWR